MTTLVSTPPLIYKVANLSKYVCLSCSKDMTLCDIDRIIQGYEIRAYVCFKCDLIEELVVELN